MARSLNMSNNKITHLANPTNDTDGADKKYIDVNYLKLSGGTLSGKITYHDKYIFTGYLSPGTGDIVNAYYIRRNFLKKFGGDSMFGNISMTHIHRYKIYNLGVPPNDSSDDSYAMPRSYTDGRYLRLAGGTMGGNINMDNHKIINLADPTGATDGVNPRTLNKYNIKSSDHTNRFSYLTDPTDGLLRWTDLLTDSIALNSIGDLNATSGNCHSYNKKVIFASIRKNSEGGYKSRLAVQCYPLQKDKEYSLCLEIPTTD